MEVPPGVPTTSSGQRQWATPEMWQSHRGIITELYQSHTLKDVMKIMEDKHKFFATVRMYKSHTNKWGLQKNFRAKQVQALLHQKAERDAAQRASIIDWANIFDDALRFLQREQNQQGFRLVQICFGQYKALLSAGSIRLFFSIYPIFIQLQHYPDLAKKMIGYASKMSETIHSTSYPFTALWREFLAMDYDEIRLNWKPLINCYSSFIAEHSNDDSELMFEAVRARNGNIRYQTLDGLVDFNLAEELFQKDITTWENYTHTSSPETVCLKRGLSTFYAAHQRYDDLDRIITEIAPWSRSNYLQMLAIVAVDQGDFVQAVELYDAWFTWSKEEFGAGHDETARACVYLENLLRDIGEMDQAEIVGKQSEISLDAMCVRLGEMQIQETCDEEGLDGDEADLTSSSLNGFDIFGDSLTYQGGHALGSVGEDAMGSELWISLFEN
ncbi:hypothetical protein NCS52_01493100 [Fusarium sp. LHS14.1]|nr:hypothetical protein NCS52_01493100 [Fusarium sp. LHS14.1]